uniref:Secreted protein n=1 Tax=Mesocestoides corti TaxID=53468 RepID=A0A5K3F606_MESCO
MYLSTVASLLLVYSVPASAIWFNYSNYYIMHLIQNRITSELRDFDQCFAECTNKGPSVNSGILDTYTVSLEELRLLLSCAMSLKAPTLAQVQLAGFFKTSNIACRFNYLRICRKRACVGPFHESTSSRQQVQTSIARLSSLKMVRALCS